MGTFMDAMKPHLDDDIDAHPKVRIFVENLTISFECRNLGINCHQNVDSYEVFVWVDVKYRTNNCKVMFCNTHQGGG